MSKSIMVGLLVASLLAGAGPALAQQGGIGDPLTLAASGVVIPFFLNNQFVSTIQVASPVADNPNAHMFFFSNTCAKFDLSVGIPLTTNDIAFQQIGQLQGGVVPNATPSGLVTLAAADQSGFKLRPLEQPVHVRMYVFRTSTGESRVIEPIIVDTAEFSGPEHWWSPLRTGATFFAPCQNCTAAGTANIFTDLYLICPEDSIEGGAAAVFGTTNGGSDFTVENDNSAGGFPQIRPLFPTFSGGVQTRAIRVRIYDTNEVFKRDLSIDCDCVITYNRIADTINPFYGDPVEAAFGTYSELTSAPGTTRRTTFTGYTDTYNGANATNHFFGRLQNGSQLSIDGPGAVSAR